MISVSQALAYINDNRIEQPSETVSLNAALGRVLSKPVTATLTQPPLSASAMDGYAVKLDDVKTAGATLTVIGEAPAGSPFKGAVSTGQAVRIFTGGAVPNGANTVIIQENVTRNGDTITVNEPQDAARHIRHAGIDFLKGDQLIAAGTRLGPSELLVAAAAGHGTLSVKRRLNVAILSNGNELVTPGEPVGTGQIVNANPTALAALIAQWGGVPHILPTARDSVDSILKSLSAASDADIIVPVGGASVGDHDHMRGAFTHAGLSMIFEKVAVRPGKPTWFGALSRQRVLGLPGNPASAVVCAHLFLKPLLGVHTPILTARLDTPLGSNGPRESYLRAVASFNNSGQLCVSALPAQDSGLMSPFLKANALLRLSPGQSAQKAGESVEIIQIGDFAAV
ncbi:molybdopterin molybdotransferase MoeA [Fretibacter rubidus]|uniref:molybdopterin molybdotransferase MoeA n=1 Tax=Fretibacter rubidus TaxID=570162 RepID=UPI00352B79C8